MEHDLKQWVHAQREIGAFVSGFAIQTEALRSYKIIHPVISPSKVQASTCNVNLQEIPSPAIERNNDNTKKSRGRTKGS